VNSNYWDTALITVKYGKFSETVFVIPSPTLLLCHKMCHRSYLASHHRGMSNW